MKIERVVIVINHRTLPRARAAYWREAREHLPWLKFTHLRKFGAPQTSERLQHVMTYRARPDLIAGARVVGNGTRGVVVEAGGGANVAVLLDDDAPKHAGLTLNFHPGELTLEDAL